MDQTVISYINKCRQSGYSDKSIRSLLLNSGHTSIDVNAAFDAANIVASSQGIDFVSPSPTVQAVPTGFGKISKLVSRKNIWIIVTIVALVVILIVGGIVYYEIHKSSSTPSVMPVSTTSRITVLTSFTMRPDYFDEVS